MVRTTMFGFALNATVFVNDVAETDRQFFQKRFTNRMLFDQITKSERRHYHSDTRKLPIQSEMYSINLLIFMNKNQQTDIGKALLKYSTKLTLWRLSYREDLEIAREKRTSYDTAILCSANIPSDH